MPRKPLDSEYGHGSLVDGGQEERSTAFRSLALPMPVEARCQADRGINTPKNTTLEKKGG